MTDVLVLILAKAPRSGRVKTRLCPPATPDQAARIAAAALLDTLDTVRALPWAQPVVALAGDFADGVAARELAQATRDVPVVSQRGTTLGHRIAAAHADAAKLFPAAAVLQIAMDTPQVTPTLLTGCRDVLFAPGVDAVLGAADDGGWWLLGLHDPRHAETIATVPTSRPDTGIRAHEALQSNGFRVCAMSTLADIDTMPVAREVAGTLPGSRFAAAVEEVR
ncbi:DUF2064 domain-containing protein [Amycolatopsis sp. OK19-0408]|uniref:DUF2064 domain-containing protein n=1 Tax=Amycolatopsis iheyensis TaxID=2945988 RepID=A0A9X2SQR4_9PSEU|nr:DUF2064 domain-containing protein [Amycolatopsis iheyensis]MCR6488995.1 DUF2064 domain-containing protein [Amycolatopsis iheyensis]